MTRNLCVVDTPTKVMNLFPNGETRELSRKRGFTLLEILLALSLFSLVMLGVWGGAMHGASKVAHSADLLMKQSEQVRVVQQFLRRYVGAAEPQPYIPNATALARMFSGNSTSMTYVAPLPMQSGHAGLYVQTVTLKKNASGVALWLAYRPYSGKATSEKDITHLLLTDLHGGTFQYLAAAAFGKPASWRDDWQAVGGLPLAVRVHLDPAWRTRVPFPDMVIPLHTGNGVDVQAGSIPWARRRYK